jgi:hypothetical protein
MSDLIKEACGEALMRFTAGTELSVLLIEALDKRGLHITERPKRVYAVAEKVPDACDYLTAGKRYEVLREDGHGFWFCSDDGLGQDFALWTCSKHLDGGNWTRIEEPGL